jgi:hypothetical protein
VKSAADVDPSELITVVSGLPRSGTSLMMQMLELGGLELFVDGQRMPDEDNPKGYCEFEKTKSLAVDNSWIGEAKGKVIKVVAPLLENLPAEYAYRVLFMHREVDEIVQSQTKMLERGGKEGANLSDEKLKAVLDYQLEMAAKLLGDKKIPTIRVPYRRVIEDSSGVIEAMKGFLKADLDWDKMVTAIDKGLYRNRAEKTNG